MRSFLYASNISTRFIQSVTILSLICLIAAPAVAIPMSYEIFRSGNPSATLGMFTVDPDLASPVGVSDVQMTALTFTEEIPPFGSLTVTLADINAASQATFRAIFSDGDISEITGIGPGTLPGLSFFLDFTPKGDPVNIDLNAVGTFAFDATDGAVFGDSATGSIGIQVAQIPEPSALLLIGLGFLGIVGFKIVRT